MLWQDFFDEISEHVLVDITKLESWQNVCISVFEIKDVHDNILLEVLLEILIIILDVKHQSWM
jgi:hypothetical protein